jgi:hypothetical protein
MFRSCFTPNMSGMLALVGLVAPESAWTQAPSPALRFSGYVAADFVTSFAGGGFKDPAYLIGLEIDLTTTITFNPKLSAVIYTTMNDGVVPAQGAGNTRNGVNFDGATLKWRTMSPR